MSVDPIVDSKPHLVVLYGSETGVSHALAEHLYGQANFIFNRSSPNKVVSTVLSSIDEYPHISQLYKETGVVLFVCSTTGYGVPPNNMLHFWRRLMRKNLPVGHAFPETLHFAVLGIGDSSYPRYNVVAKKLYHRLGQLGASPLQLLTERDEELKLLGGSKMCGLGLADEQADLGVNRLLSWWIPRLWTFLSANWSISLSHDVLNSLNWSILTSPSLISASWPKFTITCEEAKCHETLSSNGEAAGCGADRILRQVGADNKIVFDSKPFPLSAQWFQVVENRRITASDHFQDTRLILLEPHADFSPGDCCLIQPKNRIEDVLSLFSITHANPCQRLHIKQKDCNIPLPYSLSSITEDKPGVSAAWLATYYFDLNAVPTSGFFTALAALALSADKKQHGLGKGVELDLNRLQLESERLEELGSVCSADMLDDLYDYATRPRRRVTEVLADFPMTSLFLDPSTWFDILPGPILARPYSIASAPPSVELLVGVVEYRTRMSTPRYGLASKFLSGLVPGDLVSGWITSNYTGHFQFASLLKSPSPPSLLVAAGTGIAPFRSFLCHQRNVFSDLTSVSNLLCFGCRYADKDFYFSADWHEMESQHSIKLLTVFSREPNPSGKNERVYVQHRLSENPQLVWQVVADPSAFVFVVGNTKTMPGAVRQALITACCQAGGLSAESAEARVFRMENEGRLQVEAWA